MCTVVFENEAMIKQFIKVEEVGGREV